MDRNDNISLKPGVGRNLHTYTPKSHEDLLRSHLNLDAARKAKLQSDLQRLTSENERLRLELERARQDLKDKDDKIVSLKNELQRKPQLKDKPHHDPSPVLEIGGKPVNLDDLINHFNGVIQRHHDLLNNKNNQIQQLQDALNNQPKKKSILTRDEETQPLRPHDNDVLQQNLMNEFTNQLSLIRKEYDQAENVLNERNNKLEKLIEDLETKLEQYAREIEQLRNNLAAQNENQGPRSSMVHLIREKEKENAYLKEIINSFKDQKPYDVSMYQGPSSHNEDLENEIKKVIQSKKDAINKLNSMIHEIQRETPTDSPNTNGLTQVEQDCQTMLGDLNNLNVKLNSILEKLKESPQLSQDEPIDKNTLISNLENLKTQCENEIATLNNQIGSSDDRSKPDAVILRGQALVKIDDPNYLMKKPEGENEAAIPSDQSIETPSNIQFVLYPMNQPAERILKQHEVDEVPKEPEEYTLKSPEPPIKYVPETLKKHKPYTCEACSEDNLPADRYVAFKPQKYPQDKSAKPNVGLDPLSQENASHQSKKKIIDDFYAPSARAKSKDRTKKDKPKGGCCGKKGSETSNEPYTKNHDKEKVILVHTPNNNKDNYKNIYPAL